MQRDKQALIDISTAIQQTLLYAQGIERSILQEDDEKQSAILYRLIIIGEATKRLSDKFRDQYPMTPRRQMAGEYYKIALYGDDVLQKIFKIKIG